MVLEALRIYDLHPDRATLSRLEAEEYMAAILAERSDHAGAAQHFRVAAELTDRLSPSAFLDQASSKAWYLTRLGRHLALLDQHSQAETAINEAIRTYAQANPANRGKVLNALDALSLLRRRQGRPLDAEALTPERRRLCAGSPVLLYDIAGDLAQCIPLVEPTAGAPTSEQVATRLRLGSEAVEVLEQAIRAGFRNVRLLRTDPRLDPIRSRSDFRDIAADLGFPARPFAR